MVIRTIRLYEDEYTIYAPYNKYIGRIFKEDPAIEQWHVFGAFMKINFDDNVCFPTIREAVSYIQNLFPDIERGIFNLHRCDYGLSKS